MWVFALHHLPWFPETPPLLVPLQMEMRMTVTTAPLQMWSEPITFFPWVVLECHLKCQWTLLKYESNGTGPTLMSCDPLRLHKSGTDFLNCEMHFMMISLFTK